MCPHCGRELKKHSGRYLHIRSMFGELKLLRSYFLCRKCGYSEVPLDEVLELSGLPHRMTSLCQLEAAYWCQNQNSFQESRDVIKKVMNVEISSETLRLATEEVGKIIFDKDTARSAFSLENAHLHETADTPKKRTLYIMTDGAAVNTRIEDVNGSTWRENKTVYRQRSYPQKRRFQYHNAQRICRIHRQRGKLQEICMGYSRAQRLRTC